MSAVSTYHNFIKIFSSMKLVLKLSVIVTISLILWLVFFYLNTGTKGGLKWKRSPVNLKLIGSERRRWWATEKTSMITPVLQNFRINPPWTREKSSFLSPMIKDIIGVANFIFQQLPT